MQASTTPSLSPEEIVELARSKRSDKFQAITSRNGSGSSVPGAFKHPETEPTEDVVVVSTPNGVSNRNSDAVEPSNHETSESPDLIQATLVVETDDTPHDTPDPEENPENASHKPPIVAAQPVRPSRLWLYIGIGAVVLIIIASVVGYLVASGGGSGGATSASETTHDKPVYSTYSHHVVMTGQDTYDLCEVSVDNENDDDDVKVHLTIDCGPADLLLVYVDNISCETTTQQSATCVDTEGEPFSVVEFQCAGPNAQVTITRASGLAECHSEEFVPGQQSIFHALSLFEVCPDTRIEQSLNCGRTDRIAGLDFCVRQTEVCDRPECDVPLRPINPISETPQCQFNEEPPALELAWIDERLWKVDAWLRERGDENVFSVSGPPPPPPMPSGGNRDNN